MKSFWIKYLAILSTILTLTGCSGGGSCKGCSSQNNTPADNLSFIIQSPTEYPAGIAQTVYLTITNTSGVNASGIVYSVPNAGESGNTINVNVTIPDGQCSSLNAGASCTFSATIPESSTPGSFTVLAQGNASSNTLRNLLTRAATAVGIKATFDTATNVTIGLVSIPQNNNYDLYILPSNQTINTNNESSVTVLFSVLVESGPYTSVSLPLPANAIAESMLSPLQQTYESGSVLTFSVTWPAGATGSESVTAINNNCMSGCSNTANVNFAQAGAGILSIYPSNVNMTPGYTSQTYTLTDTGESAISGINIPSSSGPFTISSNCPSNPFSLAPSPQAGSSCTYTIVYTPNGESVGPYTFPISYSNGLGSTESTAFTIDLLPYANIYIKSAILVPAESAGTGSESMPFYIESQISPESLILTYVNNGTANATGFTVAAGSSLSTGYSIVANTCNAATLQSNNVVSNCRVTFSVATANIGGQNLSLESASILAAWTDQSGSYTNQAINWINGNESQQSVYLNIFALPVVNAYLSSESDGSTVITGVESQTSFYLYYTLSGGYPGESFSYSPTYNNSSLGNCLLIFGTKPNCDIVANSGSSSASSNIYFGSSNNGVTPNPQNTTIVVGSVITITTTGLTPGESIAQGESFSVIITLSSNESNISNQNILLSGAEPNITYSNNPCNVSYANPTCNVIVYVGESADTNSESIIITNTTGDVTPTPSSINFNVGPIGKQVPIATIKPGSTFPLTYNYGGIAPESYTIYLPSGFTSNGESYINCYAANSPSSCTANIVAESPLASGIYTSPVEMDNGSFLPNILFPVSNISNIMYLPQSSGVTHVWLCQFVESDGTVSSCNNSGATISGSGAFGVTVNSTGTLAYIADNPYYITVCNINQASQLLVNCTPYRIPQLGQTRASALNLAQTRIYINKLNVPSDIITCQLTESGAINTQTCVSALPPGYSLPPSTAERLTLSLDGSSIYQAIDNEPTVNCLINQNTGLFSSCQNSGYSDGGIGLSYNLQQNFMFFTDTTAPNSITSCVVNSNGLLSNCQDTGNSYVGTLTTGIGFTTAGFAYITSAGSEALYKCTESSTTGLLSNCANTGATGFGLLQGVVVFN